MAVLFETLFNLCQEQIKYRGEVGRSLWTETWCTSHSEKKGMRWSFVSAYW